MADERTNEARHPTREVRVTGERSATLVGMAIQASRFDLTILQMKMAGSPETRSRANAAAERFERALSNFDAEMREVNKELSSNTRGAQRPNNRQSAQQPQAKRAAKPAAKPAKGAAQPAKPSAKPATAAPKAEGAPKAAAPAKAQAKPNGGSQQKPAASEAKSTPAATPAPVAEAQA